MPANEVGCELARWMGDWVCEAALEQLPGRNPSFVLLPDLACTWSVDREGGRFGLLEGKDPNGMSATFRVLSTLELRCRRAGGFQHHQRPCGSMINKIPSWRVCCHQGVCTTA